MERKLKNAFRILKGGKISLVVSAVLMSAGMVTNASAAAGDIVIGNTTFKNGNNNDIYDVSEASPLSWSSSDAVTFYNAQVNDSNPSNTNELITSITVDGTNGKTINLGTALQNPTQFNLTGTGTLLNLSSTTTNTTINNYGNLVNDSYSSDSTIVIGYGINNNNTLNNYGTITAIDDLDGNGNVVSSGYAIYNISLTSTLNNLGTINGVIHTPGSIINGDAEHTNATINGYIDSNGELVNNGLINLKSYVSTIFTDYRNNVGSFTNNATGTLQINLDTDGTESGTHYTKLYATSATFADGSTIKVNVSDTSTNVALLAGSTLTDVVKSYGTLTVDGTLNITDNSALLKFEYIINGDGSTDGDNTIDLKAVKESTILDETKTGLGNKNAQNIANKLDIINDNINNYSNMQNIITKLNEFSTSKQIADAVSTLENQVINTNSFVSNQIINNISNILFIKMNNYKNYNSMNMQSMNSGDEVVVKDKTLWIKPYGSIGSQSDKDGMNGFDVKSYGIGMGFDGKDKNDQLVGFGLFLSNANVDMNNINQESDVKAYTLSMYGEIPVIDDKTKFQYQLGYTLQDTDSKREIFTGDMATADYTSKTASIDAKLVRDYQVSKEVMLQPLVFASYKNFKTPSYSETGAGSAGLDVQSSSSNEMIVGLGTIASYQLNASDKLTGSLSAGYDLIDDKNKIVSSFQGASGVTFDSVGIDNGRWSYDAGIGYEKTIDAKNSMSLNYNLQTEGTDYVNNVVSANYVYKF